MKFRARTYASIIAAVAALTPAGTNAQVGQVTGTVWDSIAGAPLRDAAVFLWDTPYQAVSDDEGRFRITDVPPGDYNLLFFHRSLGELGVSPGPVQVTVAPGRDEEVDLGTPSRATMARNQCLLEGQPEGAGAVAGRVWDAQSGLELGGVPVTLSWHEELLDQPKTVVTQTDRMGWYLSCEVLGDVPVLVSADYYGRRGARREITVPENGFAEAGVQLFEYQASRILGEIRDGMSGDPVKGAETWLRGTSKRTLTDDHGTFVLEDVAPGTYMLMTDHLAYGTKMDTLVVPDGKALSVQMMLDTRPLEIAPVEVTTEGGPGDRARVRGGIVITRDEIDTVRQRARDASDVIRSLNVPGVIVRHQSNGTICVGYITGQVKMNQTGCVEMMIFINDVRATDADLALRLPPDAIERMVIYKPVQAGNLFGLGGGNGVWMIYTRGN